eukprot:466997-Rhodomonas_salina.2
MDQVRAPALGWGDVCQQGVQAHVWYSHNASGPIGPRSVSCVDIADQAWRQVWDDACEILMSEVTCPYLPTRCLRDVRYCHRRMSEVTCPYICLRAAMSGASIASCYATPACRCQVVNGRRYGQILQDAWEEVLIYPETADLQPPPVELYQHVWI